MAEPEKINSVVEKVMGELKKGGGVEPVRELWWSLLEEEIGKHSVPVSIKEGKLLVLVDSSVWLQHLTIKKGEILKKLSELPLNVRDIRFRQGKIR